MNITDEILAIHAELSDIAKRVLSLKRLEASLKEIAGGKMPSVLTADTAILKGMDSIDTDDGEVVKRLADAVAKRDLVERMMTLATLAARLCAERERVQARMLKLSQRASSGGSAEEHQAAVVLASKTREADGVLADRLAAVLGRFFEARLKLLNAVAKMTGSVVRLFAGGDEMLRSAALKNDARGAIVDIETSDSAARAGKMTITTTGKRRVKI
jgi:hypothetical protein